MGFVNKLSSRRKKAFYLLKVSVLEIQPIQKPWIMTRDLSQARISSIRKSHPSAYSCSRVLAPRQYRAGCWLAGREASDIALVGANVKVWQQRNLFVSLTGSNHESNQQQINAVNSQFALGMSPVQLSDVTMRTTLSSIFCATWQSVHSKEGISQGSFPFLLLVWIVC